MEGALGNLGHGGRVFVEGRSSADAGFSNLAIQGWKRGSLCTRTTPSFAAQGRRGALGHQRSRIAHAEASGYERSGYRGGGRIGFNYNDRRKDSEDVYRSGEQEGGTGSLRRSQTPNDGGMGRSGTTDTSRESSDRSNNSVELAGHVDIITSVGNSYVKHLVKLRENRSYRNAVGCVVVVGSVPLREICDLLTRESPSPLKPINVLLILEDTSPRSDLSSWSKRIVYVSEPVLRKVAGVDSTQGLHGVGVLALPTSFCNLEVPGTTLVNWLPSPRRVLVLDGIQDPGNLGTLLRTAAAFAWDGVFMLPGGCDPFNEKALRSSRGASFRIPIATGRWSQLQSFANMHKMTLYAADPDQKGTWPSPNTEPEPELISNVPATGAQTRDALGLELESGGQHGASSERGSITIAAGKEALCLILGSEGQGLSENASRSCERVSILMPGDFESLNVAIAGGILLYLLNYKISVPKVST